MEKEISNNVHELDTPIMEFKDANGSTTFTRRDTHNGVLMLGGIGSGKTSSAKSYALKYLRQGWGGLVLIAKPSEADAWRAYCRQTGREKDLIEVYPEGYHTFNFLEYESTRKTGTAYTENIFQILQTVIEAGIEKTGQSDDKFWSQALESLIKHTLSLCKLAYGKITLQSLYDIAQSAPRPGNDHPEMLKINAFNNAMERATENVRKELNIIMATDPRYKNKRLDQESLLKQEPPMRELEMVKQFFFGSFYTMSTKTRGIIEFSLNSCLLRILQEPIYSLFCKSASTFTPEDCLHGKIIMINLPVKTYHRAGQDAQILFKIIFQRAMERRNIAENSSTVFLWGDECSLFLHPLDAEFQSTSRSCNVATFYITQNLANLYSSMGGANAEYRVKSYLGTLSTKVMLSNADIDSCKYGAELIGQHWVEDESSSSQYGKEFSFGRGRSFKLEYQVRSEEFAQLKNGGPLNHHKVEAYLHMQGKVFHTGNSYLKVSFNQLIS